ncbi:E3 ubiquitin-protein ligase SHPRH-like, partial [Stegodyphus dumicola]|uniref:E3 ubiquitin-protein ligase SHPRH-like n=1 Tax=Stegodyphus dumicola TaxID=202533 RepID=UPI0015AAFE76
MTLMIADNGFMNSSGEPLVNGNIDPMVSVLNQVMWRTSKKNVIEQLGIPVQETVIHKLQLSQVEKVFYETQREKCRNDFLENIKKYHCVAHAQLSKMDRYIVTK